MISTNKTIIGVLLFSTWLFFFGLSINPLLWGEQALNTIQPTRMMNLTEEQLAVLDEEFEAFVAETGEIDYYIPWDWSFREERLELKYLDLYFRHSLNYNDDLANSLSFNHYYTASRVFNSKHDDCDGLSVFIANYLIHRGYQAWVYVSPTHSWVEVYLNSDWRSEYDFWEESKGWIYKFSDKIQIYSIVPYVIYLLGHFLVSVVTVLAVQILVGIIIKGYRDTSSSYTIYRNKNWSRSEIVRFYLSMTKEFCVYTIFIPINFLKDVLSSLNEEIHLLSDKIREFGNKSSVKESEREKEDTYIPKAAKTARLAGFVKARFSLHNGVIALFSLAIALFIAEPDLLNFIVEFIEVFVVLAVIYWLLIELIQRISFSKDSITDFVEINLLTISISTRKLFSGLKGSLYSARRNVGVLITILPKFLFNNRFKIIISATSWLFLIMGYFFIMEIVLRLLGHPYSDGAQFETEIQSNLAIINLFLVAIFSGLISGITLKIWKSGPENQIIAKRDGNNRSNSKTMNY
ncbi:MAG: hypothetical protein ACFFD4_13695 [Candidatus Odinarchaeota archaeon]